MVRYHPVVITGMTILSFMKIEDITSQSQKYNAQRYVNCLKAVQTFLHYHVILTNYYSSVHKLILET